MTPMREIYIEGVMGAIIGVLVVWIIGGSIYLSIASALAAIATCFHNHLLRDRIK